MQELIAKMNETMAAIQADLNKEGNKAAQARVRKLTLEFEKLGKAYRKESNNRYDRTEKEPHGKASVR